MGTLDMNVREIVTLLDAEVITGGERMDKIDVQRCFSADLMSDVLARSHNNGILLTGLANIQAVRTADIADIKAVCIVRGKTPDPSAVELARQKSIPLFVTKKTMFEACGILYGKGLQPVGD
ncbi:MAG: DRTGG domain-containing protein [Nitrospiraceae bacterium]|nr:DRTGG domain-containing protein [Nitrospiraceae bacterium]